MKIKCGRKEFDVSNKDIIMDNGCCYQLVTKKIRKGYYDYSPVVSKTLFNSLLKNGKIYATDMKYKDSFGNVCENIVLYKFVDNDD